MLCLLCAKWPIFCQELTGEDADGVKEDEEEEETALLKTLCLHEAPSTLSSH